MSGKSWKQRVLRQVKSSFWLTSAAYLADNALASMGFTAANPAPTEHLSGTDVDADVVYAKNVARLYQDHGALRGRIAEVGPGGSAAVALHLIGAGCESVDLIDRFVFPHDEASLLRTYRRIIAADPCLAAQGDGNDLKAFGIAFHQGEEAAAECFFSSCRGYDAIVSCAVLEHLYDPLTALEAMAGALRPDGVMVHAVDFRDHGMFTAGGFHELQFLTIPTPLYRLMSERRGRPNRVLIDRYRATMERLGLEYEILVTELVGVGALEAPARYADLPTDLTSKAEGEAGKLAGRFAIPFGGMELEDLAVAGIVLTARARNSSHGLP